MKPILTPREIKKRLAWDPIFISMAVSISQMSHCTRYQVGCVIVKDRRPISTGINGTLQGSENCDDIFINPPKKGELGYDSYKTEHGKWSLENEFHSEAQSIDAAARLGISLEGTTAYITLSPCINCAKRLVNVGIERVVFLKKYDRETKGIDFLVRNGVEIEQIDPENVKNSFKSSISLLEFPED